MPEAHIAHRNGEEDEPVAAPSSSAPPYRRHSVLTILLEVLLITAGVFLGLAGESWRETRHRHLQIFDWHPHALEIGDLERVGPR